MIVYLAESAQLVLYRDCRWAKASKSSCPVAILTEVSSIFRCMQFIRASVLNFDFYVAAVALVRQVMSILKA